MDLRQRYGYRDFAVYAIFSSRRIGFEARLKPNAYYRILKGDYK